jgi:hypothetical protein
MEEQREWSIPQLEILQEHLEYHAQVLDVLEKMRTAGPSASKKLPVFTRPPKRKLSTLYGEQAKKTKEDDTRRTSPVLENKGD